MYDPLDTRPAELEREPIKNAITDQRSALNRYGNGLVYHSEPFSKATEISGRLKVSLWLQLDVPDTDFEVDVYEILQDGTSILLASDTKRARYRESLRTAKLVPAGKVLKYEFSTFNWFSRRIAAGSRLRLVVELPEFRVRAEELQRRRRRERGNRQGSRHCPCRAAPRRRASERGRNSGWGIVAKPQATI